MTVPGVSTLAAFVAGPVQFDSPGWLVLIPVLWLLVWVIARRSLAGLGPVTRAAAFAARMLVIAAVVGAMAEPHLRKRSQDVAVTVVLDVSRSIPPDEQRLADAYIEQAAGRADERTDRLGVVTTAREAYVQTLPSRLVRAVERQQIGRTDATNLAAGVRLAIAVTPEDAAGRLLLISDGNETSGSLLTAAEAARAAGLPIDVYPVEYDYPAEVIVERLVAPANARGGEPINLSVIVTATRATAGRLLVIENGEPIDLDPGSDTLSVLVELDAGKNLLSVPLTPNRPGPVTYEAVFEPIAVRTSGGELVVGDSILENNRASAVTFVGSEGWVLIVADGEAEAGPMKSALSRAELRVRTVRAELLPGDLTELNAYECIVLLNQAAFGFSEAQQRALRRYVHDSGGGLVMVGGPDGFGAGGWIGSPLEDALPVQLDPPQKRQMPMGALALVIDASGSMGAGVSGTSMNQQQIANEGAVAAVESLSRLDQVVVIAFSGSSRVVVPLTDCADPIGIARRIRSIGPGGGTNMFPAIDEAFQRLSESPAGVRHIVVLTDGVTMGDHEAGVRRAAQIHAAGTTITTIAVGDGTDDRLLERLALAGGGRFHSVRTNQAMLILPQIFMKEAQTIRRSLIWEGDPFSPRVTGVPTESMRGVSEVPPITGYVVTAPREGLAQVTLTATQIAPDGSTVEDPIAAQWQYGLGRVVAFTSDATSRWAEGWVGWPGFRGFWEQHVRWAMRPAGSANVRVVTEERGDETLLIIEALDEAGERLNFAGFEARVSRPDGSAADVRIRQVGPGRYEGVIPTPDPGAYVVSTRYDAPAGEGSGVVRGAVQAAITRPFADEFRALETNSALLRQVAALTGGEVLSRDPESDRPWRREGLTMPVSARAVWLAVAVASLGIFLADVGIRRVRIDPVALATAVARAFGRSPERAAAEIGTLREVRAKARARLDGAEPGRKFEAGPADQSKPGEKFEPIALSGEAERPKIEGLSRPSAPAAPSSGDEDGMSRLMKAKRRAAEEYGKDE